MKVNVEEKLAVVRTARKSQEAEILQEAGLNQVKGLLGYGNEREKQILELIGANSINKVVNQVQASVIEHEKAEEYHGLKVFTTDEIKGVCIDYKLKFLPSANFIGEFPSEVAEKILALEEQLCNSRDAERTKREGFESVEAYRAKPGYEKFKFDNTELKNNFAVMAPPSMFNLTVRPKPEKIVQIRSYDPVLFYKADGDSAKWAMVHKWGNDFSIVRAVKGFVFKNETNMLLVVSLLIASMAFLGLSSFTNVFLNAKPIINVIAVLAVLLVSPLLSILVIPKASSDTYSESGWNTPFKA